ncbi:Retrovirus-related Pol polyprotein from transposon [Apostichopus japonicus]|uniref:Retrovirus-related Pol polyprotein from transposon n=1 Tax=Stichopus japonicus TaxID=307972 RepID=A0A2G8K5C2_STIJA|nr:Retrovirus-related Pol polyprotein from transposon [Apostichopus japonicus]
MAYRSSVHDSTGISPAEMMLGREIDLPVDLIFDRGPKEHIQKDVYVQELEERLHHVHEIARKKLRVVDDRQKKHYDLKADDGGFKEEDTVMLYVPKRRRGLSPKLQRCWEGPYVVINRLSDVTYRIKRSEKAKSIVVHFNRLKPYQDDASIPPSQHTDKVELLQKETGIQTEVSLQDDESTRMTKDRRVDHSDVTEKSADKSTKAKPIGVLSPKVIKSTEASKKKKAQSQVCHDRVYRKVFRSKRAVVRPRSGQLRRSNRIRRLPDWLSECVRTDQIVL